MAWGGEVEVPISTAVEYIMPAPFWVGVAEGVVLGVAEGVAMTES